MGKNGHEMKTLFDCILIHYVGFFFPSIIAQNAQQVRRREVEVFVTVYAPGTTFVVFDPASYTRSVPENENPNSALFTVAARGPPDTSIAYSIVGGNADNAFKIGAGNGLLSVQSRLDREAQETYHLVVRAVALNLAAEAPVTIRLQDVNDNTPKITFLEQDPKNVAIEDFSPQGSYVIKVNKHVFYSGLQ